MRLDRAWRWVERVTGRSVVHHQALPGATSSAIHRVEVDDGSAIVLRLFTNRQWLETEPDLAEHEATALEAVEDSPVPSPGLIAVDETGAQAGAPALLMTEVPGAVVLKPAEFGFWLDRLAGALATIHDTELARFPWSYRVWQDFDRVVAPLWTKQPDVWQRVIKAARPEPLSGSIGFIHRDYHPTNVLWSDGQVSGVVDWVNACQGPPGVDVAHCRLNLAAMYGVEAADGFSNRYEAHTGRVIDPAWDLRAVTEWLPDCEIYPPWLELGLPDLDTPTVRSRIEAFAAAALTQLS